ncbi:MAG: flagellar biosynthesis protein FliQ [Planctomycetota bacterium]
MDPIQVVADLGRDTLYTALMVSAPLLLASLVIGVLISIIQAVTQVQEMTLTFIPKIIVVVITMVFFMPWMLGTLMEFTLRVFGMIHTFGV